MRRWFPILPLLLCGPLAAQNEGMLASDFRREGQQFGAECGSFKSIPSCGQLLFTGHPMHLAVGSLAPGNGMSFGPAFVYDPDTKNWRFNLNMDGVVSTNQSWRTGIYLKAARTPSKPSTVVVLQHRPAHPLKPSPPPPAPEMNFYAQGISLNQLSYYGLGNSTLRTREALYEMRQVVAGMNGLLPFGNSGFGLFGEINGRSVEIRPHQGGPAPSIEQLYTNATAPGLGRQPGFFQAGEGARFGRTFKDHLTLDYSATFQEFVAGDSTYSFRRMNLDFSHEIPLYKRQPAASTPRSFGPDGGKEILDQHKYVRNIEGSVSFGVSLIESFVPTGHVVPFYFQPTLGGTDINGDRSLPSYPDYRFRAPNLLLIHASVEHSIWGPFGLEFLTHYGRTALARTDLALDHFHHSFAAGLTIHAGGFPQVSILFAWGGGEGTHTIGYISPGLLGGSGRPSLF